MTREDQSIYHKYAIKGKSNRSLEGHGLEGMKFKNFKARIHAFKVINIVAKERGLHALNISNKTRKDIMHIFR